MGRVLCLDPGSKRIGVAVSDLSKIIATGRGHLDAASPDLDQLIIDLVEELEVDEVVVGLPTTLAGREGQAAVAARDLAGRVAAACPGLQVTMQDERFSTVIAERVLIEADLSRDRRKQVRDQVAATVILQSFLDGRSER